VRPDRAAIERCAGEITRDISEGVYEPGGKLPPLSRLEDAYGVSRVVIDLVLAGLCRSGVLTATENAPSAHRSYTVTAGEPRPLPGPPALPGKFLTVMEIATALRVSKMTVYRLVHEKELEAVQVGRSFRIPERSLHDYVARCSRGI
jgi:excisionase family DNA binding protein